MVAEHRGGTSGSPDNEPGHGGGLAKSLLAPGVLSVGSPRCSRPGWKHQVWMHQVRGEASRGGLLSPCGTCLPPGGVGLDGGAGALSKVLSLEDTARVWATPGNSAGVF